MKRVLGICVILLQMVCIHSKTYEVSLGSFSVIYEQGHEDQAGWTLAMLEQVLPLYRQQLDTSFTFEWPVFLDSERSMANGYVSLPVPRSVFYIHSDHWGAPGGSWLELLALHEGRHMVQYEALVSGASRFAYLLGGPQLLVNVSHSWVPSWIFEGDAVASETIGSFYGRGRSAEFEKRFRALLEEQNEISYTSLASDSYGSLLPNHYVYGYYLIGNLMRSYGTESIQELFSTLGRFPVPLVSPAIALSDAAGSFLTQSSLFEQTKAELFSLWSGREERELEVLYEKKDGFILDHSVSQQAVHLLTYDRHDGYQVVEVNTGRKLLRLPSGDADLSRNGVSWFEERTKAGNPDATLLALMVYRYATGVVSQLSLGPYSGTPAIDESTAEVAAVSNRLDGAARIHLFALSSGSERTIVLQDPSLYVSEVLLDRGSVHILVSRPDGYLAFGSLDKEGLFTPFLELGYQSVYGFDLKGGRLLFSSDESGVQEIYRYDLDSKQLSALTLSRYGTTSPAYGDTELYAIRTTGSQSDALVRVDDLEASLELPDRRTEYLKGFYEPIELPSFPVGQSAAEPVPYTGRFVPYAWGLLLPSEDSLLTTGVRFSDQRNETSFALEAGYDVLREAPAALFSISRDVSSLSLGARSLLWLREGTIESRFRVGASYENTHSFYLSRWSHRSGLQAGYDSFFSYPWSLTASYSFSAGKTAAYLEPLAYQLGVATGLSGSVFAGSSGLAYRGSGAATAFLPGPLADDGVVLTLRAEHRSTSLLGTSLRLPRGYQSAELDPVVTSNTELLTLTGEYQLTLGYPDLTFWRLAKLKRVDAVIFTDLLVASAGSIGSVGLELSGLSALFGNKQMELSTGLRVTYRLEDQKVQLDLLLFDASFSL